MKNCNKLLQKFHSQRYLDLSPGGHHIEINTKCKDLNEALFYVKRTIEEGWSRNALDNCLRADMYHAVGTAVTNFF